MSKLFLRHLFYNSYNWFTLSSLNCLQYRATSRSVFQSSSSRRNSKKMTSESSQPQKKFRLIDIGANLLDEMYNGMYNGSSKHDPDLKVVLDRAEAVGVERIFVTAGCLKECRKAVELCKELADKTKIRLSSTIGVHPTRCLEFELAESPASYIADLLAIQTSNPSMIVALGELGLDCDRIQFCPYKTQLEYFEYQLKELGPKTGLPLFLHCRGDEAGTDLVRILKANSNCFPAGGVVHSFDGSSEFLKQILDLGLYVGINGCSLKLEETCNIVKEIPEDRLLLETDSPWCSIRPSHFSSKSIKTIFPSAKKNYDPNQLYKTRNEPCVMLNILEVVAQLRGVPEEDLARTVHANTTRLFKLKD